MVIVFGKWPSHTHTHGGDRGEREGRVRGGGVAHGQIRQEPAGQPTRNSKAHSLSHEAVLHGLYQKTYPPSPGDRLRCGPHLKGFKTCRNLLAPAEETFSPPPLCAFAPVPDAPRATPSAPVLLGQQSSTAAGTSSSGDDPNAEVATCAPIPPSPPRSSFDAAFNVAL